MSNDVWSLAIRFQTTIAIVKTTLTQIQFALSIRLFAIAKNKIKKVTKESEQTGAREKEKILWLNGLLLTFSDIFMSHSAIQVYAITSICIPCSTTSEWDLCECAFECVSLRLNCICEFVQQWNMIDIASELYNSKWFIAIENIWFAPCLPTTSNKRTQVKEKTTFFCL